MQLGFSVVVCGFYIRINIEMMISYRELYIWEMSSEYVLYIESKYEAYNLCMVYIACTSSWVEIVGGVGGGMGRTVCFLCWGSFVMICMYVCGSWGSIGVLHTTEIFR